MSLRRRLTLSLVTILILFAVNVGTHFWGSYARNESMIAYRNSVAAAQLSTEIEQLLNDQRQQILVLSTLRDTTEDQLDEKELQQAQGANAGLVVMCTLTKVCESGAGQAAINVGGSALFAKFSRSDEAEADAEAVATTIKAGISPAGIPAMFRSLLAARQSNPGALDAFFASHPLEEDRIRSTEALIAAYSPSQLQGLAVNTKAFQTFRQRLLALPPPPPPKKP